MISKLLRFTFTTQRQSDLLTRMSSATQKLINEENQLKKTLSEFNLVRQAEQKESFTLNDLRKKILDEQTRENEVWTQANSKISAIKRQAIGKFAQDLIKLNDAFSEAKKKQQSDQREDLTEGFNNTIRLFNSTLAKFFILQTTYAEGQELKLSNEVILTKQIAPTPEQKNKIAKVQKQGWVLKQLKKNQEGKESLVLVNVLRRAKIVVYE